MTDYEMPAKRLLQKSTLEVIRAWVRFPATARVENMINVAESVVCRLTNKTWVWPRLLCRKWHKYVLSCFVTWGSQPTERLIPVIVFHMLAENIRRYPLFLSISLRKLCFIQQRISSKAPRSCSSLFLSITNLWIKSSSRRQKGPNSDFLLLSSLFCLLL